MHIGILGSGDVGRALGKGFADEGHEVMIGSRSPDSEKLAAWKEAAGKKARVGTFAEAAEFAGIAVLATLWSGTESAIRLADPKRFEGKLVIDVTNPLVFEEGKPPALALGHTDSGGEQVQRWLPGAHVVKAFNTVGHALMVHPDLPGGPPDMFICGDDAHAKSQVREILGSFGWPAIDIGGIEGARLLEPMCILWVRYGALTGTWQHAFKLLHK